MIVLQFEPKEDITAYELTRIIRLETLMSPERKYPHLGIKKLPSEVYFNSLPENVKRHLIVIENDTI